MKILHASTLSWSTRFLYPFLYTLIFIIYAPSYSAGQSIYDLAVEMDSLYDKASIEDPSSVEPFFAALRKVNKLPANYPLSSFWGDLYANSLSSEIELMTNLHNITQREEQGEISGLEAQKDSLFRKGFSLLGIDDPYKDETVRNVIGTGGGLMDALKYLNEQKKEYSSDSIQLQFDEIYIRIKFVENQIKEIKFEKSDDLNLILQEEALDLFPLGAENATSVAPPIIIQNQGGGSAQSAIIDGTAKWLAERMRQELSIAFFDRFETWAEKENIHLLFPNTLSTLKSSATTDYTLMMEIYKRAFEKDLNQLTFNIPSFLENEIINGEKSQQLQEEIAQLHLQVDKLNRSEISRNPSNNAIIIDPFLNKLLQENKDKIDIAFSWPSNDYTNNYTPVDSDTLYYRRRTLVGVFEDQISNKQKELKKYHAIKYLNFSLNIINMLQEGQHPSVLLNSLYVKAPQLFPENDQLQSILLLLNVISQSLIATNPGQNTVWLGRDAIARLSTDRQLQKFYFGLLEYRIRYLLEIKKEIQEQKKYKLLSQTNKDSLNNFMKGEEDLFNSIWDHVFSAGYDPFFEQYIYLASDRETEPYQAFRSWKMENFVHPKLTNLSHEEKEEKFGNAVHYALAFNHRSFLVDTEQLIRQDYTRQTAINSLITNDAVNVDAKYPGVLLSSPYPRLDWIGSIEHREFWNFYYYCIKKDNFETAKAAYMEETGGSNGFEKVLRSDLDPNTSLAFVDSINHVRLKARYDYCMKWMKGENYYDAKVQKHRDWQYYKEEYIDKDSLELLYQFGKGDNGFLQANFKAAQYKEQESFLKNFMKDPNNFGSLFSQFAQYTNKIDQISTQFKELRSNGQANLGNQELIYLIKNSMGILDLVFDYTIDKNNLDMVRNMETIQFATNNLLDAYIAGLDQDYNAVVMNIIPVVERLVSNKYDKLITPLENELRSSLSEQQLSMGLLPRSVALDSLRLLRDDKLRKMQEVFKYCTFIAAVAKSNGSDDVKKAINAIALPVGSYSIKRRTYANISLNAYPGLTGGFELVQNNNFSEWAPNFGFTAPIGIGINWAYRSKIKERRYLNNVNYRNRVKKAEVGVDDRIFNGHSGSFFFSFVDLGALVLFRLNDSNEPLPEDVGLKQIFSPGVAYVHGLPRVPVSIMIGGQMTPDLRKVGDGQNTESANSFRFNLSLVVDLPIANFYTRRRPKP